MAGTTYPDLTPFLTVRARLNDMLQDGLTIRGVAYDASGNTYPTIANVDGTSPNTRARPTTVTRGDVWIVGTGGTLNGIAVVAGDLLVAKVGAPAQTDSNWQIVQVAGGTAADAHQIIDADADTYVRTAVTAGGDEDIIQSRSQGVDIGSQYGSPGAGVLIHGAQDPNVVIATPGTPTAGEFSLLSGTVGAPAVAQTRTFTSIAGTQIDDPFGGFLLDGWFHQSRRVTATRDIRAFAAGGSPAQGGIANQGTFEISEITTIDRGTGNSANAETTLFTPGVQNHVAAFQAIIPHTVGVGGVPDVRCHTVAQDDTKTVMVRLSATDDVHELISTTGLTRMQHVTTSNDRTTQVKHSDLWPTVYVVTEAAHGLGAATARGALTPIPVRNDGTNWVAANASGAGTLPHAYVVEIIDVNTLVLQETGYAEVTGHGFTPGSLVYVNDAGALAAAVGTVEIPAARVADANILALINPEATQLPAGAAGTYVGLSDTPTAIAMTVGIVNYTTGVGTPTDGETINFAGGGSGTYSSLLTGTDVAGTIRLLNVSGVATGDLTGGTSGWTATTVGVNTELTTLMPVRVNGEGTALDYGWSDRLEDVDGDTMIQVASTPGGDNDEITLDVLGSGGSTTTMSADSIVSAVGTGTSSVVVAETFGALGSFVFPAPFPISPVANGWSVYGNDSVLAGGTGDLHCGISCATIAGAVGNSVSSTARHDDNASGDVLLTITPTLGILAPGDVVTGGTSGATGTVVTASDDGTLATLGSVVGTFVAEAFTSSGLQTGNITAVGVPSYFANAGVVADGGNGAQDHAQVRLQVTDGAVSAAVFMSAADATNASGKSTIGLSAQRITLPDADFGDAATPVGATTRVLGAATVSGAAEIGLYNVAAGAKSVLEVSLTGGTFTVTAAMLAGANQISITGITAATTLELAADIRTGVAANTRKIVDIKDESGLVGTGGFNVTITDAGGGTPFEGFASLLMAAPYNRRGLDTNGTVWFVS